jgi:hypothetical protein
VAGPGGTSGIAVGAGWVHALRHCGVASVGLGADLLFDWWRGGLATFAEVAEEKPEESDHGEGPCNGSYCYAYF